MKYAIVGLGSRHKLFRDALTGPFAAGNALVALCDSNPHRLALSQAGVRAATGADIPGYGDFTAMLAEARPEAVIVTTPDFTHHRFMAEAMRAGADVITEKPMTTDLGRLGAILAAQRQTGRAVTVTFNYRYAPARTQVKEILVSGAIGEIVAVDFRWHLDRVHGADYFRRWHRERQKSGGLLVHKATHHFDLINWWIGSTPARVAASGRLAFYRPETAAALGLSDPGPRCRDCVAAADCDFALDLSRDEALRDLYLEAEHADGYVRDACVFAPGIDIEDTVQAHIAYASGATANYSLVAYSPWEGLEVRFIGTAGELAHSHVETHGILGGTWSRPATETMRTVLHRAGREPEEIAIPRAEGSHGGADPVMLGYILAPATMPPDQLGRAAGEVMGAWSILTGLAANRAIAGGGTVVVDDMLAEAGIALPRP